MCDLKKYVLLDEDKIRRSLRNEDKLGGLNFISNYENYWKELFSYNKERMALENFMLYRTAGEFNLHKTGVDDADITTCALDELKNRLLSLLCVEKVKVGKEIDKGEKERAFLVSLKDGRQIYLESDTGNSLMGDIGNFLRIFLEQKYGAKWPDVTYIKKYNLNKNVKNIKYYAPFRNYYFYTLISKIKEELKDETAIECFIQLEKRAVLTHSLKNMILVPYGYNSKRGYGLTTYKSKIKINDRLDLTFVDFREMLDDEMFGDKEFEKRLGYKKGSLDKKCNVESVKFLLENKEELFPKIPVYTREAEKTDMKGILERTKLINETLL